MSLDLSLNLPNIDLGSDLELCNDYYLRNSEKRLQKKEQMKKNLIQF